MVKRRSSKSRVYSPGRAVAILSCALTLLAAKPVAAASTPEPMVMASPVEAAGITATPFYMVAAHQTQKTGSGVAVRQAALPTAKSRPVSVPMMLVLQHLAQLVAADVKTVLPCPVICTFELVAFDVPAAKPMVGVLVSARALPPPYERQFAIAQCLLAPPC